MQYVFYDADSCRLITEAGENAKMSFGESFLFNKPEGGTWLKWFSSLGQQVAENSPFVSDKEPRTCFVYSYKPKGLFSTDKFVVSDEYHNLQIVYPGEVEDSVAHTILMKMDSLVLIAQETLRRTMENSITKIIRDSTLAVANKTRANDTPLCLQMLKKSCSMNGLVVLAAQSVSGDSLQFKKFFSSVFDSEISDAIYSVFQARDTATSLAEINRSRTYFLFPLYIKIYPGSWDPAVVDYLDSLFTVSFAQLRNLNIPTIDHEIAAKKAEQSDAAASMAIAGQMASQAFLQMQLQQMQWRQQQIMTTQLQQINQMQMQRMQQMNIPRY